MHLINLPAPHPHPVPQSVNELKTIFESVGSRLDVESCLELLDATNAEEFARSGAVMRLVDMSDDDLVLVLPQVALSVPSFCRRVL